MIARRLCSLAATLSLAPLLLSLSLGCGRIVGPPPKLPPTVAKEDPFEVALERFRKAAGTADVREALREVGFALERDDKGLDDIRQQAADLASLKERLGLDPDEIEEATAPTFRKMDAHHVELCFQLRDVAESLQVQGPPPLQLQQAEAAFAWSVRHLLLRCGDESRLPPYFEGMIPPQFALLRGEGSSHERAMLFLELLRQFDIDGCMIALPGPALDRPRYWVPGALIQDDGKAEVYLFDTRLGMPLPGPGGKGIATLSQVRTDPKLLDVLSPDANHRYDVTFEQAKLAEPHLVCPLTALAPRMQYLEERLAARERIRLAVNPVKLLKRFEDVTGGKVQVWNRPSIQGKPRPITPTRALRLFLPSDEGGLDKEQRLAFLRRGLVPLQVVLKNYRDMRVYEELPKDGQDRLGKATVDLFVRFLLTPHEQMTRGRFEEATRKLSRIPEIIGELDAARLPRAVQAQEIALWLEHAKEVYLPWVRNLKDPAAKAAVEHLWSEDQYLVRLVRDMEDDEVVRNPGEQDPKRPRPDAKKTLTFIVLGATGEPLREGAEYLLALCWLEKAERLQRRVEQTRSRGGDEIGAERAVQAWKGANFCAQHYAEHNSITQAAVGKRAQSVLDSWRAREQVDVGLSLWDQMFRNLRRSAACRLSYAKGLRKVGKDQEAAKYLSRLSEELDGLRSNVELKSALGECLARGESLLIVRAFLQSLARELGPNGSISWMNHSALVQRELGKGS